jgi:hypothetical protein
VNRPDNKNIALEVLTGLSGDSDDLEQVWLETVTGQTGGVNDLYAAMYAMAGVDDAYDWLVLQGIPADALPEMWNSYWLSVLA